MKIYFITQFFRHPTWPYQTGGTISNYNLVKTLALENEVTVLSLESTALPFSDFETEPFSVVNMKPPEWRGLSLAMYWSGFVQSSVIDLIQTKGKPDLLIATTSTLPALTILQKMPEVKTWSVVQAYENFGWFPPTVSLSSRIALAKLWFTHGMKDSSLLRLSDLVITNSVFMRDAICRRFRIDIDKIVIIPQLCDVKGGVSSAPDNTVGFVNRGSDKNLSFVFLLAKNAPELKFLVFGHTESILDDYPENMAIEGWKSDRTKMFASAKVWIVPSLWAEPFGRVSIEAQAADRAVLVANVGGLPETVIDLEFIQSGYRVSDWLTQIKKLMSFKNDKLQANGQRVRETFSQESHDNAVFSALEKTEMRHKDVQ